MSSSANGDARASARQRHPRYFELIAGGARAVDADVSASRFSEFDLAPGPAVSLTRPLGGVVPIGMFGRCPVFATFSAQLKTCLNTALMEANRLWPAPIPGNEIIDPTTRTVWEDFSDSTVMMRLADYLARRQTIAGGHGLGQWGAVFERVAREGCPTIAADILTTAIQATMSEELIYSHPYTRADGTFVDYPLRFRVYGWYGVGRGYYWDGGCVGIVPVVLDPLFPGPVRRLPRRCYSVPIWLNSQMGRVNAALVDLARRLRSMSWTSEQRMIAECWVPGVTVAELLSVLDSILAAMNGGSIRWYYLETPECIDDLPVRQTLKDALSAMYSEGYGLTDIPVIVDYPNPPHPTPEGIFFLGQTIAMTADKAARKMVATREEARNWIINNTVIHELLHYAYPWLLTHEGGGDGIARGSIFAWTSLVAMLAGLPAMHGENAARAEITEACRAFLASVT